MKVFIATPVKCEEAYVREWLDFHKNIGVDKIILGDNNDSSYPIRLKDVVQDYIDSGFVEVLDYRDKPVIQLQFMRDVYSKYKDCSWIGYVDVDEFIELPGFRNIKDFLATIKHEAVVLRWYIHSDNNKFYFENKPVRERFPSIAPNQLEKPQFTKYFIRAGLNYTINHQHCPPTRDACDVVNDINFKAGIRSPIFFSLMYHKPDYLKTAYVSHYATKTAEEFIKNKAPRGMASTMCSVYDKKYYLHLNGYSPERDKAFDDILASVSAPCKF